MAIKIGGTTIIDDSRVLINTGNVGVGTTNPNGVVLPSNTSIVHAGIVTANFLYGDGSNLINLPDTGEDNDWIRTSVGIHTVASKVGIGTTNPTQNLEVRGNIRIEEGDLLVGTGRTFVVATSTGTTSYISARSGIVTTTAQTIVVPPVDNANNFPNNRLTGGDLDFDGSVTIGQTVFSILNSAPFGQQTDREALNQIFNDEGFTPTLGSGRYFLVPDGDEAINLFGGISNRVLGYNFGTGQITVESPALINDGDTDAEFLLVYGDPILLAGEYNFVGIGTDKPLYPLHVEVPTEWANSSYPALFVDGNAYIKGNLLKIGDFSITLDASVNGAEKVFFSRGNNIGIHSESSNSIAVSGSLAADSIIETVGISTNNITSLNVTVGVKTTGDIYLGAGSTEKFLIEGNKTPYLHLTAGRTYRFNQDDPSNVNHTLKFYTDLAQTSEVSGVTTVGTAGTEGAYTQIVTQDNTPSKLFYGSISTSHSGNMVMLNASNNISNSGIVSFTSISVASSVTAGQFYGNGSTLTNLNASNLSSGTIPDARFPATLPAVSGANLTNLPSGISSISISSNVENQSQYITYATSIGGTTGLGVTTGGLTFNPSAGRMGIGATSPIVDLHILSGTSSFSPVTNYDKLVIENQNGGQGAGLQLVSPNVSEIGFSDASRNAGLLSYNHTDNSMSFDSGGTKRVIIDSSGNIGIGTNIPSNAAIASNTKILNVGVVTANNYYGSGANLTNLTGASAATYGDASNVAQVVVDANGRITGISNVAISGAGGGGGGSGTFDTGITTSIYVSVNGGIGTAQAGLTTVAANNDIFIGPDASFTFPATAGKSYVIESIHVTNIYNTNLYFTSRHDFNGGKNVPTTQRVVVPYQGSLELLEEPIIAKPSDVLSFQALNGVGTTATGVNNGLDSFIIYSEKTDTDYIGTGVTVSTPAGTEMFTSNTNPSVIQSLRLCNYDLSVDVDASVSIYRGGSVGGILTTGVRQGYLVYNMTIPKNSVIEVLERPKYLAANDTIVVGIAGTTLTDSLSATLSGKYIT